MNDTNYPLPPPPQTYHFEALEAALAIERRTGRGIINPRMTDASSLELMDVEFMTDLALLEQRIEYERRRIDLLHKDHKPNG